MPNREAAQVLSIQSYDFINGESGEGSRRRIGAGCDLIAIKAIPRDCFVVWPQGFSKKDPLHPSRGHEVSLGRNMLLYALSQQDLRHAKMLQKEMSFGTKGDMLASYGMIAELGYDLAHFHFVTDPVHLWRVRLVWWMTHPRGWTASFHPAHTHKMSAKERFVHEPIKFVSYLLTLLPRFLLGRPMAEDLQD